MALVLSSLKRVSLALPGNSLGCLSSDRHVRDAWCTCHRGCVFLLLFALVVVDACLVAPIKCSTHCTSDWCACHVGIRAWSPCLCAWENSSCCCTCHCCNCYCHGACAACIGHAEGDDSCHCHVKRMTFDSCAGWQNVAVCIRHACVAAIDALAAIIIIFGWVSLWYSQRPHSALVSLLVRRPCGFEADCHGLTCQVWEITLWALLRLTMKTLIVSIMIGDGYNHVHCKWQCHCRLLLLIATAPSSDAHVTFAAMLLTSSLNWINEISILWSLIPFLLIA